MTSRTRLAFGRQALAVVVTVGVTVGVWLGVGVTVGVCKGPSLIRIVTSAVEAFLPLRSHAVTRNKLGPASVGIQGWRIS